jgi:hypothetical protein
VNILRLVVAIVLLSLVVTVATGLVLLEVPPNYSGFNEMYVYGFPLGWFIVQRITTPTDQVREITDVATVHFIEDFVMWTFIVGGVVVAGESLRRHQRKTHASHVPKCNGQRHVP